MSVDLGTAHWDVVDVVDGFALLTNLVTQKSRWLDVRTWPPKRLPIRDEWTRAVCPGATLAGWATQRVYTWKAQDKRRTELVLPAKTGFRAVGLLDGMPAVVPGALGADDRSSPLDVAQAPMIFDDGAWRPLAGEGGGEATLSAIVPLDDGSALVVWSGRVLRYAGGKLVETAAGDLPRAHPSFHAGFLPSGDGFVTAAGGKLVWVVRHGKQRDDRAIGKLQIVSVARYEGLLLVREPARYHLYDESTRKLEPLDLGSSAEEPSVVFPAPCGLLGLVDDARVVVRYRV
jgi:hypothetical protein